MLVYCLVKYIMTNTMLKLKWFILGSLWATLAAAEEIQCKGEFVKEPPLLQASSELSQQNKRLKNQVQTSSHRWMSFEAAKDFIKKQGLTSQGQFEQWSKSGERPGDFPSAPYRIYKEEWTGWGDFLGTGNIAYRKKEFMSFEEAKTFIRNEGIQTSEEFQEWKRAGKRPEDFPSNPQQTYKEEWTGWGDFLGTGSISTRQKEFMSFEEAKDFIKKKGLTSQGQFHQWSKSGERPGDFPSIPHRIYEEEWTSWGDFLGTGNAPSGKKEWMGFEEAKTLIQKERFTLLAHFRKWSKSEKRPANFPSNPNIAYKDEWTNWNDFLGTEKHWMSFQKAKTFIQKTGLVSPAQFEQWSKSGERPGDFPRYPMQFYKEEWTNWSDFLNFEQNKWMSFEAAKDFIKKQGLTSRKQFKRWIQSGQKPENFPSKPHLTYKEEWTNWNDFLGIGNMAPRRKKRFMSFSKAKIFIRNQDIQTSAEFNKWKREGKRPEDFPSKPHRTYKEEWTDWNDFLGIGNMAPRRKKRFMSFNKAKTFIRNKGFTSKEKFEQWRKSSERPKDFPSNPNIIYKEKWTSWGDFLGTGNIAPSRKKEFMSFEEAQAFIRNEGVQTSAEFQEWKRAGKRPKDFPSNPNIIYEEKWTGWEDFLGTGRKWMSFEEAQAFIRSEGIQSSTEFEAWSRSGKRPDNFPSAPHRTYKEEWTGWRDFLGTGNIAPSRKKEFMSFEAAQAVIWSEGIQTRTEFEAWNREGKRPADFPANPQQIYEDKWTGWSDFLGAGNISSKRQEWMSKAWKKSGKRSENFPSSSERTNKDKSTSGGILGTGNISTREEAMSFEEAQSFIRNEGIQSSTEFEAWSRSGKRPEDFPSSPEQTYKDKWTGWNNFLGTGNISTREESMSFEEAKKYVQTLGFDQPRDFIEWLKSSDRPIHFPPNPHQFYSEWISVKDFLSTEQYVSYKEAKTFVQSLAITNSRDFLELMRDEPDVFPDNFPPNPNLFYSKTGDWIDWNDFLGITDQSKNKADDRRIFNTEDNLQNEEMAANNFIDETNLQYADMY